MRTVFEVTHRAQQNMQVQLATSELKLKPGLGLAEQARVTAQANSSSRAARGEVQRKDEDWDKATIAGQQDKGMTSYLRPWLPTLGDVLALSLNQQNLVFTGSTTLTRHHQTSNFDTNHSQPQNVFSGPRPGA